MRRPPGVMLAMDSPKPYHHPTPPDVACLLDPVGPHSQPVPQRQLPSDSFGSFCWLVLCASGLRVRHRTLLLLIGCGAGVHVGWARCGRGGRLSEAFPLVLCGGELRVSPARHPKHCRPTSASTGSTTCPHFSGSLLCFVPWAGLSVSKPLGRPAVCPAVPLSGSKMEDHSTISSAICNRTK